MEKLNVVLVALNEKFLNQAISTLNFDRANLITIITEGIPEEFLLMNDEKIPVFPFAAIQEILNEGKDFIWLINGFVNGVSDIWTTKKFLISNGIPEENIVNFEVLPHISFEWLGNLRYIEEHGADFFATGISYTEVGLDLNYIPPLRGGVNLSGSNQDLQQSYLTAKHVFEHVKPGTIKFVLIGLAPYSFRYDNAESFSVCSRNLQYMLALNNKEQETRHDYLLKALVNDKLKNIFVQTTAQKADLNFERLKRVVNAELPARALVNWENELDNLTKKLRPQTIQKNIQILKDYIKLCLDNGAKPVGVVLPFAPAMHDNYSEELLTLFRLAVQQLEESYDFKCIDLFDLNLDYDCFYNMAHLNLKGAALSSLILSLNLHEENILSAEDFCGMNYRYFQLLANFVAPETYNSFIERVFKKSVELIRRKDKIKVGFVLYDSSMWSGDDLYNYFAADEKFEPTIFLCLRNDKPKAEIIEKEFCHGVDQFKSRGLNVVAVNDKNFSVPEQDLLIFLAPYFEPLPLSLRLENISAKTLVMYVPYAISITKFNLYIQPIFNVVWKAFFTSTMELEDYKERVLTGMPNGLFSGYPKMDIFFKDNADFRFNWKTTQPDAKKIIWAPHWSINDGVNIATFQWNYKFLYLFASEHPEISWVVKPHPNLFFSAVKSGLFRTTKDFEAYLQAWNDLPNAQVYTGAYYQDIFATSDGMIHDCSSFVAEYQYVDKPMIYLTRSTQNFYNLGEEILRASYLVDGQDLDAIAALIQRIFIEGDDFKAAERKEIFDKYLNYPKYNGMLASEFIYKSIANDLK
ncbi:MAG: CDP-glycerol glycerophosphotransferase family protein [Selenomonadaceae bacterium]|nr:CDP-glycerol glycerophosphotransferase family protein [Selenomonadaceae bacterium]